MTKTAALLLASSLALAACASDEEGGNGGSGSEGSAAEELNIGLAFDIGGEGDRSFNDSSIVGVEAAIEEHGGEYTSLAPNADASNRVDLLTQLADAGHNPVIAVGFSYGEHMQAVAEQYPDTTFAVVDASVVDFGADNLTGLLFAANEGSYLAGVAAALKTTTNHIGFVGGVDVDLIKDFEAGFIAGAKAVKPDITIDSTYLTALPDLTGFNDPAKGQIAAQGIYDAGADIIYHAAGGSGIGVFKSAAASNKRAIGVDQDQYQSVGDPSLQPVIMTSVLKRVDLAVGTFIDEYVDGSIEGGEDILNDLSTGGIQLATSGGFIDDIQDQIDEYKQQIIDGEIEVPQAE